MKKNYKTSPKQSPTLPWGLTTAIARKIEIHKNRHSILLKKKLKKGISLKIKPVYIEFFIPRNPPYKVFIQIVCLQVKRLSLKFDAARLFNDKVPGQRKITQKCLPKCVHRGG